MSPHAAVHALFVQQSRELPLAEVQTLLRVLARSNAFASVFVRELLNGRPLTLEGWQHALSELHRATRSYATGDRAFLATVQHFQQPAVLQALQSSTVSDTAPLVVLAALARDSGEASFDALVAEFYRAVTDPSDWGLRMRLLPLTRFALASERWSNFEGGVAQELKRREQQRARSSLARRLGLEVALLDLFVELHGSGGKPRREVGVIISISDRHGHLPTQVMGLKVSPPTDLELLPPWLQKLTRTHGITWAWNDLRLRSNVRGRSRLVLTSWLRSSIALQERAVGISRLSLEGAT